MLFFVCFVQVKSLAAKIVSDMASVSSGNGTLTVLGATVLLKITLAYMGGRGSARRGGGRSRRNWEGGRWGV